MKTSKKLQWQWLKAMPAPRNPLATAARLRQAGPHGPSRKTERQAGARALRRTLTEA